MDFLGIISVAFLSSFSHCVGMCGGFVVAYSTKLSKLSKLDAFYYFCSYHLGRIMAYVLLGVFLGLFGSVIIFDVRSRGLVFFLVGVFMVVLGIGLIIRGKALSVIENNKLTNYIMRSFRKFATKNNLFSFMVLGFMNGLLPCGVVYYFLAVCLKSANLATGALIMFIFGLCTIPAMAVFSVFSYRINQKLMKFSMMISSLIIIVYGIYLSYTGFLVFGGI